jgi:hypothetical protein
VVVGHSYGGLIIKQVRQDTSKQTGHVTKIEQAFVLSSAPKTKLKGVIFLGTPHRGTPFARFGINAARLFAPLGSDVDVMLPLVTDNASLDDLDKDFREEFKSTERRYYFEKHKMNRYFLGFIPWIREFVRLDQSPSSAIH